jgi:autotransporter-associated beta strand protein
VLDLNGQNQTVGTLTNPGTPAAGVNSTSGFITNSGTTMKTLTVGNAVTSDFTYSGVIQHNVSLAKAGSAVFTLNNANTYRGDTTISSGTLKLGQAGTVDDSPWIKIGGDARLDVSSKTSGYTFDGVISGGGTDTSGKTFATATNVAKISGAITVGDHVGEVCLVGSMSPGGSSVITDIQTAGNQIGHIYTNDSVTLSGQIAGSSPAASTTRLTLQLNGATATLASLGYTSGPYEAFIDGLPTSNPGVLSGVTGNLAGHDYVNVGGALTLNANGKIAVTNFGTYTPVEGDLFNLMDWVSLTANSFTFGSRYQNGTETTDLDLPSLSGGLLWDTSLFQSHGVVVVVSPEPGRVMLLLLGLLAMLGRRRRR